MPGKFLARADGVCSCFVVFGCSIYLRAKQNLTIRQVPISSEFIERLERLRFHRRWNWEETAKSVGVSRTMIHFIKTGKHGVSDKLQSRLEQAEIEAGLLNPGDAAFERLARNPTLKSILESIPSEQNPKPNDSLVSEKNKKAITQAFKLTEISGSELTDLYDHVIAVSNRAPEKLSKYYILLRVSISAELNRRLDK